MWPHQLTSPLKEGHTDKGIFDAIRSSFHGKAANIIVGLGIEDTVKDIFQKRNSIFDAIDTEADLLATFYGAHQGPEEAVAGRGCRLEGLLDSATRQPPTLLCLIGSLPA